MLDSLKIKKWPSKSQWRQFLKVLTKREKVLFFIFSFLALGSFIFLTINFYFKNTEIRPAQGGIYVEGIVGQENQPRFINPIYAPVNDTDRDLVQLLFSGLMEYDQEGNLYPKLAQNYEIKEEGKIFEFYLKENLFWDDGFPLTTDDVIFTIKTIQNPDYKSPLRAAWLGVEIEKVSDKILRFKLKNPSAVFLESLTLKILPKHIWQDIPPENFQLAIYNLQPIGSGPYKLKEIKKDELGFIESLTLIQNPNYYGKKPNIDLIVFLFFEKEEELIENINLGKIKGFSLISIKDYEFFKNKFSPYHLSLPRYFAVFFNPEKSKVLAEKEIRKALNYGTNKIEILEKVLIKKGEVVDSPILPEIYNFSSPSQIYEFNLEKAKEILDKAGFLENQEACSPSAGAEGDCRQGKREKIIKKEGGFQFKSDLKMGSSGEEVKELQKCLAKDPEVYPEGEITGFFGNSTKKAVIKFQEKYKKEILEPWGFKEGTGIVSKTTRAKLNELCAKPPEEILSLKFSLVTVDQPILVEVANLLKSQWENLGAEIEVKTFDISTLKRDIIKPRDYESLLFGEVLGLLPDPLPFWHSLQKIDPGLNLALYENKIVDKLLEEIRQNQNPEERIKKYQEFQNVLIDDAPAVFLYNPDYIYFVSNEIKGVNLNVIADPSKRFSQIEDWYIKTKRVLK